MLKYLNYLTSVALCCALVLVAALLLDVVLVGVSLLAGLAPNFGVLIRNLAQFAAMGGTVLGLNRILLRGSSVQRTIAVRLAGWLGTTFTLISGLFLVVLAFPAGRAGLTSRPGAMTVTEQIFLYGFMFGLGVLIFVQVRRRLSL